MTKQTKIKYNRILSLGTFGLALCLSVVMLGGCSTAKKTEPELTDQERQWIDNDTELWLEDQGRPKRAMTMEEKAQIRREYRELLYKKYRYLGKVRSPYLIYQAETGG